MSRRAATGTRDSRPVAPPIPNDTAFFLRFFEDISGIRDDADNPLHEVDFREELSTADVRRCPYHGSRHGHLMNQAALRRVGKDWRRIRSGLRFLVESVSIEGLADGPGETIWARSLVPMFVPSYLLLKARRSGPHVTLPTDASDLFKVTLDVPTTIDLMLIVGWVDSKQADAGSFSAMSIAEHAEKYGVLNNGEWTCAASPALMRNLLSLLEAPSQSGQDDPSSVAALIELEEFEPFVAIMIRRYALSQAFQLSTTCLMERAFSGSTPGCELAPVPEASLSAYETRRRVALHACSDEAAATRAVGRYCAIAACRDSSRYGVQEPYAAMLDALEGSTRKTGVELLEAQLRIEEAFRIAVADMQDEASAALGLEERTQVDFARLWRSDFPTAILRERLRAG